MTRTLKLSKAKAAGLTPQPQKGEAEKKKEAGMEKLMKMQKYARQFTTLKKQEKEALFFTLIRKLGKPK